MPALSGEVVDLPATTSRSSSLSRRRIATTSSGAAMTRCESVAVSKV
jgi:hypothetical protein